LNFYKQDKDTISIKTGMSLTHIISRLGKNNTTGYRIYYMTNQSSQPPRNHFVDYYLKIDSINFDIRDDQPKITRQSHSSDGRVYYSYIVESNFYLSQDTIYLMLDAKKSINFNGTVFEGNLLKEFQHYLYLDLDKSLLSGIVRDKYITVENFLSFNKNLLITEIVRVMSNFIPENATLAITEIEGKPALISGLRNEITYRLFETRKYKIIDRANLDTIIREQNIQWSGEMDTKTAVSLGKFAGANIIMTGNLQEIVRGSWRGEHVTIQALDVETGNIISIVRSSDVFTQAEKEIKTRMDYEVEGIKNAVNKMKNEIPSNSKIAVYDIYSSNKTSSLAFTEEVTYRLFKTNRFIIMNRADIDKIFEEQKLGTTGHFDKNTTAQLRRLMGVDVIITGSVTQRGDLYYITLHALDTETAKVISIARENYYTNTKYEPPPPEIINDYNN
jgi:curli biogenesis system outer membrane secretion channel CsgG/DNA-directed RNA polymerase subunit H (RpoH/RPB5)